jgi:hypothetical protein
MTVGENVKGVQARFQSRYDLRTLVDVAAAVARVADPTEPAQVTQKQWDAARTSADSPDAPSARQVAVRLQMPWADVLALAFGPTDIDKSLGHHFGAEEDSYLDGDDVRTALRTVALRLNKRSLTTTDYSDERERMLASARRRHGSELYLPNVNQVEHLAGSWDAALALAGLGPRPPQARRAGLMVVEVLELALCAHGCLLTKPELSRFAAANQISVANRSWRAPWASHLAELRQRRAEWGLWTPPCPPTLGVRPDYTATVALPPDVPQRLKRRWSREECIVALIALLDELPAKTRLTMRVYQQQASGRDDLPALHTIQRHAAFSEMVAEARKKRHA